jgi:hypothetical protein
MRCPRCPNGAVIASNADPQQPAAPTARPLGQQQNASSRPATGPYVDLTLTMQQMPAELKCRNCGWKRDADGMSVSTDREVPFADSSTQFELLSLADIPLHPGLEASGRNDDLIQRLMHFPRGVLCTSCGGPSEKVAETAIKASVNSFKNLPQPPNDIESRASWWGFKSSNFTGRPVILEWYYVVTRNIESNDTKEDMVDLCIGCAKPCLAKYAAKREAPKAANPTGPLPPDWAQRQRQRERESRRLNPRRKKAERAEDGTPVPGTGGIINSDDELIDEEGESHNPYDDGDEDENGNHIRRLNNNNNNDDNNLVAASNNDNRTAEEEARIDLRNANLNNRNNNLLNSGDAFAQPHDHTTGANLIFNNTRRRVQEDSAGRNDDDNNAGNNTDGANAAVDPLNPVGIVADPQAVKEANEARAIAIQQTRILEEARKHMVTLLEDVLGPPSTWPRNENALNEKCAKKPFWREIWNFAAFVWVLASSSPTKSGAMLEWSLARDFLIKRFFTTNECKIVMDTVLPRDPRDPDILMWSEKCTGVHTRAGALIFARRLHDCVPLQLPDEIRWALRDAVSVANRTRALRILASGGLNAAPIAVSSEAAASSSNGIVSAKSVFADTRFVRFPIGWITPHAWKSMQARAFRFAMFVIRQAELDGKNNANTVYLVSTRLMLRFMTDATSLTENSFFSLLCGLPYNDPETREYVVIDFRDQQTMRPPVQMAVDRLVRISRGANWEAPNPNWGKSLIYTSTNNAAMRQNNMVHSLIEKLPSPEGIQVLKIVACHEDVTIMNEGPK